MNSTFFASWNLDRVAPHGIRLAALAAASSLVAACQTLPAGPVGAHLNSGGAGEPKAGAAASRVRRDEVAANGVTQVYIEPSVLEVDAKTPISPEDLALVRWEVDRQLCYKISQRFAIVATPAPAAGRVRTVIVRIEPTSRGGSAITAAASLIFPVPVRYRGRAISGGLAAESTLLTADGREAAAVTWTRSVQGWSLIDPSLSPVGDALQLADPFAEAVGEAFRGEARARRPTGEPRPCARFGPRRSAGRTVGSALLGLGAGLYAPSVAGAGRAPEPVGETPSL